MRPPIRQGSPDDFQTPPYALDPLLPFLKRDWVVWECACGKGNLVRRLKEKGYSVIGTDILSGQDFLGFQPDEFDCIVTNPPYKTKNAFLERAYELRKPFAFLMPLTTLETKCRQSLMKEFGVEIILFDKRINFEIPNNAKNSSSWFATAWFTSGLNIGRQLSFANVGEKESEG